MNELNAFIERLEAEISTQESMNQVYESFATTVLAEMRHILQHCEVHITDEFNNKKRQAKKPWWTVELTTLWKWEIIRDKQQVLTKWQNDFKELLNPVESMEWDIVDAVN